ncbi:fibril-forming collagen alpha chain-like isoform X2 [Manis pentadactyla]|uniref:fibril-forming collagen alpha chain-like isoform X2 n=1 Tax=Manis pentadactyla TaxID=143292 RepID=UPI00255CBA8E|nr:fibril-forming collagen alpha chain-like isoform X2 [Manis pentadactyla]
MAAPRGPHPLAPAPPPAHAGLRAARRASGGAGREPLGLGGAGRRAGSERGGRGRGGARRRVHSGFRAERLQVGPERGPQGRGRAGGGREPGGRERAARGAAARAARGVASAPGSRIRTSARQPRPLLDVSSRSRRGRRFFPPFCCQGSRQPRGEAPPSTFKGAEAVGTRGERGVQGTRIRAGDAGEAGELGLWGLPGPFAQQAVHLFVFNLAHSFRPSPRAVLSVELDSSKFLPSRSLEGRRSAETQDKYAISIISEIVHRPAPPWDQTRCSLT